MTERKQTQFSHFFLHGIADCIKSPVFCSVSVSTLFWDKRDETGRRTLSGALKETYHRTKSDRQGEIRKTIGGAQSKQLKNAGGRVRRRHGESKMQMIDRKKG